MNKKPNWKQINRDLEREIEGDKRQFHLVLLVMTSSALFYAFIVHDSIPNWIHGIFAGIASLALPLAIVLSRRKHGK